MTPAPLPEGFDARPFAHRALHGDAGAENSLGAIRAAVAAGYGIEIDIQPSADGVPMVFHDYALDRLTGQKGAIARRTAAELGQIMLLKGGGTIPTLTQVLAEVAGRVPLLIEIKDQDGALGPNVGPLERAVCTELDTYDGAVAVMSFNPHSVIACAETAPDLPRGLTTCPYPAEDWPTVPEARRLELKGMPDLARCGASFISHQWDDLAAPEVAAAHNAGCRVYCWTIRSATAEATARRHADQVTFEGYLA